ncbi:hypothetical protein DXC97_09300 [Lachnospiraceae bacterium TF09-5]|nr:hypothetical protein DXC97_09300 [Lachnospiraceae bacterium TF09-5]
MQNRGTQEGTGRPADRNPRRHRDGNANLTEGEELNCYEETASYVKIPERILRSYDRRPI